MKSVYIDVLTDQRVDIDYEQPRILYGRAEEKGALDWLINRVKSQEEKK